MNIRKRFVIFSIILGIVPVIISTSICIINFNAKSIELIKKNVIISAHDQSMNLEYFFNKNVSDLNTTATIPIVKDLLIDSNNQINIENGEKNSDLVNEILKNRINQQFYLSIGFVVNNDGIIISSSDKEYINKKAILSSEELDRLAHDQVVKTNIIEREDFNKGIKSAIIASPIFFKNQYQGYTANVINMSYFKNIVNDLYFFKNGKMIVMDENGVIAAGNSKDVREHISEINNQSDLYEKWIKIDFDRNPNGIIEYSINGIRKIGYYSRSDNTEWVVLSVVEWTEFKSPIESSIKNIVSFLIFIFVLIIAFYIFIINYFSKPMYKLLEAIRKIKQGNYKDRFIYDKDNEFGEISIAFNELIDTVVKHKKHIEDKNRELQSLTSNIPGGVYRCRLENEEFFLDFVSSGCLNLLGYKNNEFIINFDKKFIDLIYEKDCKRVVGEIARQLSKSNKYTLEYRIKRNDGSIIWVIDNGQIVKDKDGRLFSYSVIINITESKIIQEELRVSEERYRLIMSQTEDIIFEWNINEDIVRFSDNWKNKFNYKSIIMESSKKIYKTDIIYKEDIQKLGKVFNNIIYGDTYQETEIRLRKNDDNYIWCKIRITSMFDKNGNIFKAMGVIIDINKEKMEAEALLFKAERDSLTGVYNKGMVESIIEEYIEDEELNSNCALFVIDVDNFKAINDNLGHLAGDSVLSSISLMISEVFYENSIVGRIGGDEFIVFLKDIDSEEFLHKKADELVKGFRKKFTGENLEYKVSGSIGIAKYPQQGKSFKELFVNADKAVYMAKNKGKDAYCISDEM